MTNEQQITRERVVVALDIAKCSHDAAIQLLNGRRLNIKIPNTREGYEALIERCGVATDLIDVGFEPTADYHRNIAYWLADAGCPGIKGRVNLESRSGSDWQLRRKVIARKSFLNILSYSPMR